MSSLVLDDAPRVEVKTPTTVYPRRADLRRAERASGRRGGDRRPAGHPRRPGPHGAHPNPLTAAPAVRRPTERPWAGGSAWGGALSKEVPTPAWVLPDGTRPAPLVAAPDGGPDVPEVPEAFRPPTGDLPVVAAHDPAVWALDPGAEPRRSGRRRASGDPEGDARRKAPAPATVTHGVNPFTTAGAARLLVLALVVGVEGVAVSQLTQAVRSAPHLDGDALAAAIPATAVLADSADRHRAAMLAQVEAAGVAAAQSQSGGAKVAAAVQQAQAAAARIKAEQERIRKERAEALRNAQQNPKAAARALLADRGWDSAQFNCLDKLWTKESNWNYRATNPSSGAYGIPQSLPASKMASAGPDWRTNPVTQIRWGLDYIAGRYGTPCNAWAHSQAKGWY